MKNFPLYRTQFPDNTTHGIRIYQSDGSNEFLFNDWRISYTLDGQIGWIDEFLCDEPYRIFPVSSITKIEFLDKR